MPEGGQPSVSEAIQTCVYNILYAAPDVQVEQLPVIAPLWIYPVAQENVNQIICRVYPNASACESCMSICGRRYMLCRIRGFLVAQAIVFLGFIKPKPTATDGSLVTGKPSNSLLLQVTLTIEDAAIQQHLIQPGQIIGVAE